MPHFGHVVVLAVIGVMDRMLIGVLAMSSLSGIGRCDMYSCVTGVVAGEVAGEGTDVHVVHDINPYEPLNMRSLLAFD